MKCPRCNGAGEIDLKGLTFGDLLLSHRNALGWTQEMLAEAVGCTRSHIANLELNRSDCPLKTIQRIADAFHISAKDLIP